MGLGKRLSFFVSPSLGAVKPLLTFTSTITFDSCCRILTIIGYRRRPHHYHYRLHKLSSRSPIVGSVSIFTLCIDDILPGRRQ